MASTKSDTTYHRQKASGKLKIVPSRKADLYIVKFYEGNDLVEYKRVSQKTGTLLQHKLYKSGRPSGKWMYYSDEGKPRYERDCAKLVYGACKKEAPTDEEFTLPQFRRGEADLMAYLGQNITYPAESKNSGATGCEFLIILVSS